MTTLLLDLTNWDLLADANGNIAMADEPYSYAQDVASAIKTFKGEVWYNTFLGLPYFEKVLGRTPPISLFKQLMVAAALTVPGVVSARCLIETLSDRTITGAVEFTDVNGGTSSVGF